MVRRGTNCWITCPASAPTSQMFDAAYWRAKEGELARTIVASPRIRAARVHIANPSADPFQPDREVTASVAIRPAAAGLAPGHAQALRYLVALIGARARIGKRSR